MERERRKKIAYRCRKCLLSFGQQFFTFFFSLPDFFAFFFFRPPPFLLSFNSFASRNKGNIGNRYRLFFWNSLMEGAPGRKIGERKKQSRKKTVEILNKQIEEDKNSHNTQQLKTTKKKTLEDNN